MAKVSKVFVVGFTARKGGTGKTTCSFNVGFEFARRRKWKGVKSHPVFFVDVDPQAIGKESERAATTLTDLFRIGPFDLTPLKLEGDRMVEARRVTKETVERTGGFELFHVKYSPDPEEFDNADPMCSVHDKVFLAHLSTHISESPGMMDFGKFLNAITGAGFDGIVVLDTPPLNVRTTFVLNALEHCDLVVPVLNPESYDQIPDFIRRHPVRFIVLNQMLKGRTKEAEKIRREIEGYLKRTTLDEDDVIWIPSNDQLRSCTNTGVPARCRNPKPQAVTPKFHHIAWRIEVERERRSKISEIRL
ncbi:ParA family protein [Methanopyrus kandleri]|uniref:ATPase involved in chromosome partitioning n=1 Tax=Methanopyrus kandleri (strain AV19 / DSM 6324 / JCM 9639 / NBRC 100938) TaxID=190192 RepID=Q8TVX6_METKA|nr:ParA family protein [Methanopyrus kandleri]AAM02475.1 ATPase involved in chromosome partitioning [Methanopyrus kandleri AV19]